MIDSSRHKDYFNPHDNNVPIKIIGAGATGSRVFEALINLGLTNITVFDDDVVEQHNLANQLYRNEDIGKSKVTALAEWEIRKTGVINNVTLCHKKVEGNMKGEMSGIVFLLTDTIESRKEIYMNSLRFNPKVDRVIETRMALVHGNIRMFDPKNTLQSLQWLEDLPDEGEIERNVGETTACGTALTVGTTANVIANLAVNMAIHHMRGDKPDPCIDIMLEPLFINASRWNDGEEKQTA